MSRPEDLQPYWLQDEAGQHDVVLSTRFRLARNLQGSVFPNRASYKNRLIVRNLLERAVGNEFPHWRLIRADAVSPALRELFFEKHLISPQINRKPAGSTIAFSTQARFVLMINEEDHLRIQLLLPGWSLLKPWKELMRVEQRLSHWVDFAFDNNYGYLTSCLTNLGTGIRASVMAHLPALNWGGSLLHRLSTWPDQAIEFRGIFGEGSHIQANFVQISNRYTLGSSVEEISARVHSAVEALVEMERSARETLQTRHRWKIEDSVFRALALLKSARIMNSEEAATHLGTIRLGACLGLLPPIPSGKILRLLISSRPAHLHLRSQRDLRPEERDIWRAQHIRSQLVGLVELG